MDICCNDSFNPWQTSTQTHHKKMVDTMKVGSVIMDLASEFGGNCDLTKHGEIINYKSKTIVGPKNLPSSVSQRF